MMVEFIMVIGITIKWKDLEHLLGQMDENMKVSTKMIKKKVMVHLHGLMAEHMKENGSMENNMEKENIQKMELQDMDSGKKVKE